MVYDFGLPSPHPQGWISGLFSFLPPKPLRSKPVGFSVCPISRPGRDSAFGRRPQEVTRLTSPTIVNVALSKMRVKQKSIFLKTHCKPQKMCYFFIAPRYLGLHFSRACASAGHQNHEKSTPLS